MDKKTKYTKHIRVCLVPSLIPKYKIVPNHRKENKQVLHLYQTVDVKK